MYDCIASANQDRELNGCVIIVSDDAADYVLDLPKNRQDDCIVEEMSTADISLDVRPAHGRLV
jgi:hypothetical protein